ncbi:MAG: GNAT family protein [Anaerolineae bacterium]|jgi:RimJ/RimL family protein N-acetyltransferase
MTLPITTARLVLRRYTPDDAQDILTFASHPSVTRIALDFQVTAEGVQEYIERQNAYQPFEKGKCFDLAIELKEERKVIGFLGFIHREHQQGEIGYALGVDYRGRGLATEAAEALVAYAFDALGLHKIQADTSSANPGAWRLMERLGMRREGRLREVECSDGAWTDRLLYGILADEWQARQEPPP